MNNMKHKHAELMMEYAKDALETDKPWERWEYKIDTYTPWREFTKNPEWIDFYEYRRKPRTILINRIEVPEPHRGEIKNHTPYFMPYVTDSTGYMSSNWFNDQSDLDRMAIGVVHLTKEAAIQHAKALLSFTKEGDQ